MSRKLSAYITGLGAIAAVGIAGVGITASAAGATPLSAAASSSLPSAATTSSSAPVKPVAKLDLTRYIGRWYQVAAIPQIFEVQCSGNSTAVYTANSDGTVGVTNTCQTWWGSSSVVSGAARVENAPVNSVLTVSFTNVFGKQLYFGGPNYEVIGLDGDYQWALVVSPDRASAFVLSRTPSLTPSATTAVRNTLATNGINSCSLKTTPQTGGITVSRSFC